MGRKRTCVPYTVVGDQVQRLIMDKKKTEEKLKELTRVATEYVRIMEDEKRSAIDLAKKHVELKRTLGLED